MKRKNNNTIDDLFQFVILTHWSSDRFLKSGHTKEVKWNYEKHIKLVFGHMEASKVTKLLVREWHQKKADSPYAANRALEVLSTIFNKAIEHDKFFQVNPCSFVSPFVEKKRKRYATQEEISKIGQFLLKERQIDPVGSVFLLSLLFTGARPRSLERARHEDLMIVDGFGILSFQGKSSAVTGEDETLIFPPFIMQMIYFLPKRRDGLIFGIKVPRTLWEKVKKEVGCLDLWARDLRRTFATVGRANGVKMDTLADLLNHRSVQTTKIYAKLYDPDRVKAVADIAEKMNSLILKKVSGE